MGFLNKFEHKFNYGDCVINHKGKSGVIDAIRIYQDHHFQSDKYMIDYNVDPSPGYESDDEFWESEVNLRIFHSTETGFEWTEKEKLEGSRCCV